MKKICRLISLVLVCICSIFAFSGCGTSPFEGDPEKIKAMLDNFTGIKALYINNDPTAEDQEKALAMLQNTSTNILTTLAQKTVDESINTDSWNWAVSEGDVTNYATVFKNNLTGAMLNQTLALTGENEIVIPNESSVSIVVLQAKIAGFRYYGLKTADIDALKTFVVNSVVGTENLTGAITQDYLIGIVDSAVESSLESELGEGITYFYNVYVQNYSIGYLKNQLSIETNENPFYLEEQNYFAIIYMTKNTVKTVDDQIINSATYDFGFWQLKTEDDSQLNFSAKINFRPAGEDSSEVEFAPTVVSSDKNFYIENPDTTKILNFSTAFVDSTNGGSPSDNGNGSDATPLSVFNGEDFNTNIMAVVENGANGLKYRSTSCDVLQINFENSLENKFAISGIGSLLFQKV